MVLGVAAWIIFSIVAAPGFGTTDVYLFRDAACNLLNGAGFTTASFEHSTSFQPLLYSSYTPLTQWVFLPFAAIFHNGLTAATAYDFIVALISEFAVVWLLTERLPAGKLRMFAILTVVLTLPVGYLGVEPERPEPITFFLLLVLLLQLRGASNTSRVAMCGFLGGLAFLAEPAGGVMAAFLVGGAIVLPLLTPASKNVRRAVVLSLVSAIGFFAPIAVTIAAFQHQDSQSVARFIRQATVGGLNRRQAVPEQLGTQIGSGTQGPALTAPQAGSKYVEALRFFKSTGPLVLGIELAMIPVVLTWLFLALKSRGTLAQRAALLLLGMVFFVAVFVVFPLQGNYLILARCLFPFVLLANWAGCRSALRWARAVEAIAIYNLVLLLPGLVLVTLQRVEGLDSYRQAEQQASSLKSYLAAHGAESGVVLVPHGQYYLYKQDLPRLFNPAYLSPELDFRQVVAIADCQTATHFTRPAEMPLPEGVDPSRFTLIEPAGKPVEITLFGQRVMSRNWTWTCDIYVAGPGPIATRSIFPLSLRGIPFQY